MAWPFSKKDPMDVHQESASGNWTLSVLFNDGKCETWICTQNSADQNDATLRSLGYGGQITVRHTDVRDVEEGRKLAGQLGCST